MKLTALPVNVGDSFLLRDEDKIILVDGGMHKQNILNLLYQEHIPDNHIDLLVCTHYDADHINGIIGILKSNKFTFKELWLPEILGSIGYTLSKKIGELFKDLRENEVNIESENSECESIFKSQEDNEIHYDSKENNSFEAIDTKVLDDFLDHTKFWYFDHFFLSYSDTDVNNKMMSMLNSTVSLISNSLHSGAYIRWFKCSDYTHRTYGYDLYSENALQTDITLYSSKLFFLALYHLSLSDINKYSLVYLHHKENVPDILFSADSDLNFYLQPVALKDNSIITAPHHGSHNNDNAYQKISGNNLIYVRSDRSQQKRPGPGYLSQPQRYCTICRNYTFKHKVELNYNGSSFNTNAVACTC
jgi:hypothetical protein